MNERMRSVTDCERDLSSMGELYRISADVAEAMWCAD